MTSVQNDSKLNADMRVLASHLAHHASTTCTSLTQKSKGTIQEKVTSTGLHKTCTEFVKSKLVT